MEMNVFMDKLTEALIARGVTETNAQKHTETLRRSFDEDDLREIEDMNSTDEIDAIADSVAAILNRKKTEKPGQTDINPTKNASVVPIESQVKPVRSASDTTEDEYFEFDQGDKVTTKGMAIFWCGLFVTLPVTLAILAVIYGLFAAAFAVIFGLIIGLIIAMIAIIAAGAVCSLIGIIYGITQLFSFVEAGIYEIGLGVIVAGSALLLSVLIYNLAVRVIPLLIPLVSRLMSFVSKKLKYLFLNVRRECYKL